MSKAKLLVGIISYLPNDTVKRTKRLKASAQQLEWLHKIYSKPQILFIAQNYTESELPLQYDNITIERYERGLGCGGARNKVLDKFYPSDYDWLLLMDDDTIIDDKYSPEIFMHDIIDNFEKFDNIDAINAVEPEYQPYKKNNFADKANLTYYKFTRRPINSGSATLLLRNPKKYFNEEPYFSNPDANIGEGTEDVEFRLDWIHAKHTWYTMETWIRKSLAFNDSTIWLRTPEENTQMLLADLSNICERYKDWGLHKDARGKIVWSDFNAKYNHSEQVLYIPRSKNIEYAENVIPKEKPIANALF